MPHVFPCFLLLCVVLFVFFAGAARVFQRRTCFAGCVMSVPVPFVFWQCGFGSAVVECNGLLVCVGVGVRGPAVD